MMTSCDGERKRKCLSVWVGAVGLNKARGDAAGWATVSAGELLHVWITPVTIAILFAHVGRWGSDRQLGGTRVPIRFPRRVIFLGEKNFGNPSSTPRRHVSNAKCLGDERGWQIRPDARVEVGGRVTGPNSVNVFNVSDATSPPAPRFLPRVFTFYRGCSFIVDITVAPATFGRWTVQEGRIGEISLELLGPARWIPFIFFPL